MLSSMLVRHISESDALECGTYYKLQVIDNQWPIHRNGECGGPSPVTW
jgi:hypothetical protein